LPERCEESKTVETAKPSESSLFHTRHRRRESFQQRSKNWSVTEIMLSNKHPWFSLVSPDAKERILVTTYESSGVVDEFDSGLEPLKTAFIDEFVVVAVGGAQPGLAFWDDEALHPQKREIPLKPEDIGFDIRKIEVLAGINNIVLVSSGKAYALIDLTTGRRFDNGTSGTQELQSRIVSACTTKDGAIWIALEDGNIVIFDSHTCKQKCVVDSLAGISIRKLQAIVERNCVAAIVEDGIMLFGKSSRLPFAFLEPPFQTVDGSEYFVSVSSERYLNENPSGVSSTTIYAITRSSTLCIWSLYFTVSL